MAVVHGYCSVQDVRDQLVDSDSKMSLVLLEKAVNAASRAIDKHCRRRFWLDATATTHIYPVASKTRAVIDDIGSTVGLVIKTDPDLDGTWATTWAASDYQLGPLNHDVFAAGDTALPFAFWSIDAIGEQEFTVSGRRATLQVTARHGWSAVPDEVSEACVIKAVSLFKRKDAPFGVAGFNEFGAVRITRQDVDVLDLLKDYRRMQVLVA